MRLPHYLLSVFSLIVLIWLCTLTLVIHVIAPKGEVDAAMGQHTIFQTEAKIVVYNSPTIAKMAANPEVVLLGASNVNLGMRPTELSPMIGGVPVHNLAIGGQNVKSLGQLVDLIYRQTASGNKKNIVFIVGAWYGLFVEDKRRWPSGLSDVDQELLRYGLYGRDSANGASLKSRLPDKFLSIGLESMWPFMVPYAWYSEGGRFLMENDIHAPDFLLRNVIRPWYASEYVRNTSVMTKSKLASEIRSYEAYLGDPSDWGDSGFQQLEKISAKIRDAGGRLIVIDMPITAMAKNTTHFSIYKNRMNSFVEHNKNDGIKYINLRDALDDADFFDGVHPRPKASHKLAYLSAAIINQTLNEVRD